MAASKITVETTIDAPRQHVWDCATQPAHITGWNFASDDWQCPHAENDLRPGGAYKARMEAKDGSFGFDFEAVYDVVDAPNATRYTLGDGRRADLTYDDLGDGRTHVRIVFDAEGENSEAMQKAGWQAILDNFKKYAEAQRAAS